MHAKVPRQGGPSRRRRRAVRPRQARLCGGGGRRKVKTKSIRADGKLRQNRKESNRELAEVGNVDVAVAVEIEGRDEAALSRAQVERGREQSEIGDIDVPVAVDVAIEAEQALGVTEDEV